MSDEGRGVTRRRSERSRDGQAPRRPAARVRLSVRNDLGGESDSGADSDDPDVDPRLLLQQLLAEHGDEDGSDGVADLEYVIGGAETSDEEPDGSEWEEASEDGAAEAETEARQQEAASQHRRGASRTILRRVIQGFGFGAGGGDSDDVAQPAEQDTQPQAPLDADVAAQVNRDTAADAPRFLPEPTKYRRTGTSPGGAPVRNVAETLLRRESGRCGGGHFTAAQRAHVLAYRTLPFVPVKQIDSLSSRAYTGRFSRSGNVFVAAFQHDRKIKIWDVDRNWRLQKDIHARNLRWTVTDTDISPSEQFLIYSTINPDVHLVNLAHGGVASEANVTDIHEALHFSGRQSGGSGSEDDDYDRYGGFGIWSVRWSGDGREILAGTGDNSLYIYDVAEGKVTLRVHGHRDDVNAVAWADDSGNVLLSGSDDRLVKVWDRRTPEAARGVAAGNHVGHLEGVTHIDPKGDGRHFISNGKDQKIKLWDMRVSHSRDDMAAGSWKPTGMPRFQWDYRWMSYPASRLALRHPRDCSLMTYKGHVVTQTLIRAYFSPAATTGQRYIYSGSADGSVRVWDLVSGAVVDKLDYHDEIVRDCSWHPTQPMLVTSAFDGTVVRWERQEEEAETPSEWRQPGNNMPRPGSDQLAW